MKIKNLLSFINKKDTLFSLLFILLINFILLKNAIMSIALILVVLFCIFGYWDKKEFYKEFKNNSMLFLFFTSYYIFNIITLLWSNDFKTGISSLQHSLILLVLPLAIIFFKKNIALNINLYFLSFVIGLSVFCFGFYNDIILGYSLGVPEYIDLKNLGLVKKFLFIINNDLNSVFETASWGLSQNNINAFFFRHHAYFSAILLLGVIISFWLMFKLHHKMKFALVIPLVMFSYTLLGFISLINKWIFYLLPLLLFSFNMFVKIYNSKKKNYVIVSLIIIFGVVFSLGFKNTIWSNISNVIDEERKVLYNCFSSVFNKKDCFFGVGIGDAKPILNECVDLYKTESFLSAKNYNTHSEFLHFLLSGGIINLLLYLWFLIFLIYKSIKSNNSLLFFIVLVVIGNNLVENFSNRVLGAFTTIIFLLLAFFYKNEDYKLIR